MTSIHILIMQRQKLFRSPQMVKRKTQNQMRLGIMSNSGGVGKTTIAAHLAYSLAQKGYKTLVIELDQQDSFRLSTGLGIADLSYSRCSR
ncbi:ParA family protein [Pseudanabaenaceae cyanobacterium LEGE 13415]|nr:ParA family protein [Pseudanabaenaceae cyanobacterium LEGE 13415]